MNRFTEICDGMVAGINDENADWIFKVVAIRVNKPFTYVPKDNAIHVEAFPVARRHLPTESDRGAIAYEYDCALATYRKIVGQGAEAIKQEDEISDLAEQFDDYFARRVGFEDNNYLLTGLDSESGGRVVFDEQLLSKGVALTTLLTTWRVMVQE